MLFKCGKDLTNRFTEFAELVAAEEEVVLKTPCVCDWPAFALVRLREVPILPVAGPCFHNLVKSNPEKDLTIQEEVELIVDRLNFLADLVVSVETDLMSKSEGIN